MVTKWKNKCERIWEKRRGRWIVFGALFGFIVLFVLGAQTLLWSLDFGHKLSMLRATSYVETLAHEKDFCDALCDLEWNVLGEMEEGLEKENYDIEPYYEYISFQGEELYHHETNISETLQAGTSRFLDVNTIRQLCEYYYIWDGEKWMINEENSYELPEYMGEIELAAPHTRLVIGYTSKMLNEGQVRLTEWKNDVLQGLICTIIGLVGIILFGGMYALGRVKNQGKKVYWDRTFLLFGLGVVGVIFFWIDWDTWTWDARNHITISISPVEIGLASLCVFLVLFYGYRLGREMIAVLRMDSEQRNWQEKIWVNHWFKQCAKWLQSQVKDRVTGAYYYGEGLVKCQQMRQKFTFILAGVMLVVAFEGAVLSSGLLYMTCWAETDMFAFFLTIFLVFFYGIAGIVIYRWYKQGTKMLFTEYDTLMNQLECLIKGEFENEALLPEMSVLAEESQKLALLGGKMSENVQKQIQAERMKIDLITNVSHDLKTPLTSVISYLDLLSKEELVPVAKDYVDVLQNKSGRLKKMIEDVFELTKASSRNLPLNKEPVNMKKLLLQTLADMQQEIEKAPVKVVEDVSEVAAIVYSDGQKLYRILQNLLENALRYAMPETRIYVTLKVEENQARIMVKNVSSYEMDFTEEEVLGRFFRGDKARSTEGSGLGLAIAKEFTEVCGGTLGLSIDGDVFGVEVALPLQEEKEQE